MKTFLSCLLLFGFSSVLFADSRFVETPPECHLPWDNGNVNNEYKLQSCEGALITKNGGGTVDAMVSMERKQVNYGQYTVTGENVRDPVMYPGGVLKIRTSGYESGTDCNIIDADGNQFVTENWHADTIVKRTYEPDGGISFLVDVTYRLSCVNAVAAQ